jgi:hypothetical protein
MAFSLTSYFTKLDLYGQPILFWYKGSRVFTSSYGIFMSLVIIILVLSYFVQLVVNILSADKPHLIDITEDNDNPPRYEYLSDYLQVFGNQYNYTQIKNETEYGTYLQVSFAIEDLTTNTVSDFDPTLISFYPYIYDRENNKSRTQLFYDYCKRFPYVTQESFDYFELNKTLCILSDFTSESNSQFTNYKKFVAELNACKNNTYVYIEKAKYKPYLDLQKKYAAFDARQKINLTDPNATLPNATDDTANPDTTNNNSENNDPGSEFLDPDTTTPANNNTDTIPTEQPSNTPIDTSPQTTTTPTGTTDTTTTTTTTPTSTSTTTSTTTTTPGGTSTSTSTSTSSSTTNRLLQDLVVIDPLAHEEAEIVLTEEQKLEIVRNNISAYTVALFDSKIMNATDVVYVPCKSQKEIIDFIKNHQIIMYFTNAMYNITQKELPITRFLDTRTYGFSTIVDQTVTLNFKRDKFVSYNSLLPQGMINNPPIYLFANLDYDYIRYGDYNITNSDSFMSINIVSSKLRYNSQRTYPNIFNVMGTVGGINKIMIIVATIVVGYYANLKLKETLINDLYSVIDPNNDHLINLSFKDYVLKRKSQIKSKRQIGKDALDSIIPDDIIEKLSSGQLAKSEQRSIENKFQILYEVYKYQVYGGLRFSVLEDFSNTFCFCCLSKKLTQKNKLFKKACKKLEEDTDFVAITKSIQEFETLKKVYLDTPQLDLFNSYRNDEITLESAKDAERHAILEKKEMNKKENKVKLSGEDVNLAKKAETLSNVLDKYIQNKIINERDKLLLDGLIEDQETFEKFVALFDLQRVRFRPPSFNVDYDPENNKLSPEELKNIEKAFKKN